MAKAGRWEPKGGRSPSREIVVDQVRDLVDHRLSMRRFEGRRRVVIIDPADAMNVQAQNALLKTLEEPPEATTLVLVSSSPGRAAPDHQEPLPAGDLRAAAGAGHPRRGSRRRGSRPRRRAWRRPSPAARSRGPSSLDAEALAERRAALEGAASLAAERRRPLGGLRARARRGPRGGGRAGRAAAGLVARRAGGAGRRRRAGAGRAGAADGPDGGVADAGRGAAAARAGRAAAGRRSGRTPPRRWPSSGC